MAKKIVEDDDEHDQRKLVGYTGKNIDDSITEEVKRSKKKKWIIIGLIIAAIVILTVVLCVVLIRKKEDPSPSKPSGPAANPYGLSGSLVTTQGTVSGVLYASEYPQASSLAVSTRLLTQVEALAGQDLTIDPHTIPQGVNNKFVTTMSFQFGMTDTKVAHLVMKDALSSRYEVPEEVIPQAQLDPTLRLENLGFSLSTNPFSFQFADLRDSSNVYVHTKDSSLVMFDKYIQMELQLPSQRTYGFGERIREFTLGEGSWTMWAKDQNGPYDSGIGGKGEYGVHPFILVQSSKKGDFFGMFFKNSNAQSPLLKHKSDGGSTLTYITTGGVIDIYFFLHGSAKDVIQAYHKVIGTPALPPFWALGWHQASATYLDSATVEAEIAAYSAQGVPLESMWLDLPYLDNQTDFSVNDSFGNVDDLAKMLHGLNQKLVVGLRSGLLANNQTLGYFSVANSTGALIRSSLGSDPLVLDVGHNKQAFIDWFSASAKDLFTSCLSDDHFYKNVPFDGLWLDMNEATAFSQSPLPTPNVTDSNVESTEDVVISTAVKRFLQQVLGDSNEESWYGSYSDQSTPSTYNLPFVPGFWEPQVNASSIFRRFDNTSLWLNATHPSNNLTEYDLHNLYGHMMAKTVYEILTNSSTSTARSDRRPFILSRSTFASSGKYAAHGLTGNWRNWSSLNYSIAGIMNMNMFGIPLTGADVCGSLGPLDDKELCARWIQLSTFYPFAKASVSLISGLDTNVNQTSEDRESPLLEESYLQMIKDSLHDRYQFLRTVYTCLFEVHQNGGTCFDPLFYYYPNDEQLFSNIESSFMVAGALKVSPVLNPLVNTTNFTAYFPQGKWLSLRDFSVLDASAGGKNFDLQAQSTVQVHLKEGAILAFQNNTNKTITTTTAALSAPVTLIVNPDALGYAEGSLYLDKDGDSMLDLKNGQYAYYKLTHSVKTISVDLMQGSSSHDTNSSNGEVDSIVIGNSDEATFACFIHNEDNGDLIGIHDLDITYVNNTNFLTWSKGTIKFNQIGMIQYGNSSDLNLCDPDHYQYMIPVNATPVDLSSNYANFQISHVGKVLPDLNVTLQLLGDQGILNIKINYNDNNPAKSRHAAVDIGASTLNLTVDWSLAAALNLSAPGEHFRLDVLSPLQSNVSLYSIHSLVFDDYFVLLDAEVTVDKPQNGPLGIWGLSENVNSLYLKDGIYTSEARGTGRSKDQNSATGSQSSGHHPVYFGKTSPYLFFGVFNLNSNAADFYVSNFEGSVGVTQISTGGMIDLYVMSARDPETIVQQYQSVVGYPQLVPQWGLGWHQSRLGYTSTQALRDVVGNYSNHSIPLEALWSDLDYMDNYKSFSIDQVNYANLSSFIDEIHTKGIKYVPRIDPGIARRAQGGYEPYSKGAAIKGAFITIGDKGEEYIGQVWPGDAVFPDFLSNAGTGYWKDLLSSLYQSLHFDGLWEHMNEASNFCDEICYANQQQSSSVKNKLRYTPGGRFPKYSISPDAKHANGQQELDTHNLFGFAEAKATADWFLNTQHQRPFIVSRSTHAGQGKYGSHWLGENSATAEDMGKQVSGIMMMNMFGIPFTGADICGYEGNATAELCARWTTIGSFSPFSRNHNSRDSRDSEPYAWTESYGHETTYGDIMATAIRNKYHLIRYYYSQLAELSRDGGAFYKPLFFQYPEEPAAYIDIQNNILLGDSLKLSVLADAVGQDSTSFYYPSDTWCNVFEPTEPCFTSTGEVKLQPSTASDFHLYISSNSIIPMQNATHYNVTNTKHLQALPVEFHVAPMLSDADGTWSAAGTYYTDDGDVLTREGNANLYELLAMGNKSETGFNVSISVYEAATNANSSISNCSSAINNNDLVEGFQLYNAASVGVNKANFTVTGIRVADNSTVTLGVGAYIVDHDRAVFTFTDWTCLATYSTLIFSAQP